MKTVVLLDDSDSVSPFGEATFVALTLFADGRRALEGRQTSGSRYRLDVKDIRRKRSRHASLER